MAIPFHPQLGTIVICDFRGFVVPEMVKRRPAIVISPNFKQREQLCTIVPLSTTPPNPIMPYHYELTLSDPLLPPPYNSRIQWVKADMFATVSFNRLFIPCAGKDKKGKRMNHSLG
jgi:mRNA interferase MazF